MTANAPSPLPRAPERSHRPVLRHAIASQLALVVGAAALLMCWQGCESLVPVVIGATIDRAIEPTNGHLIVVWIAVLTVLFAVLSVSFRFGSRLSRRASEQAAHDIRVELVRTVLDPRTTWDRSQRTSTVVSIAGSDTDRLGSFCGSICRICGAVVSIVVTAVALVRISTPLGVVVLIGAPLLLVAVHLLGAPLERRSATEQSRAAEAASAATDFLVGLRVLKGVGGERAAAERYRRSSRRSLAATLHAARAEAALDAVTLLLTTCFLATVALVGGRFATEGSISVGDFVAAVGLAQFLIGPLSQLSSTAAVLARARASAARVASVLDLERIEVGSHQLEDGAAGRFSFGCDTIEFTAGSGELLGIAADTVSANAIVEALTSASTADVRIDGVPLTHLSPDAAARALLVARHDAHLFGESVHDAVAAVNADPARVAAAIAASDTTQVAATLPDGLATVVTEHGRSLSGGQRQRVALARALAANPVVLVLHDPTTAVDSVTEVRIAGGIREMRRRQTTIVIATSPALLAACDRVEFVVDGEMRGAGTHRELAADPGYRRLVFA